MAYLSPMGAPPAPEWHSSSFSNQHRSNILSHSKRKAEDELESQSHISSQFKKLRLQQQQQQQNSTSHTHNNYHAHPPTQHSQPPVSFRPHIANTDARPAIQSLPPPYDQDTPLHPPPAPHPTPVHLPPPSNNEQTIHPPTLPDTDFMTIDDTPHRIIIHDLRHEIAQIEAEERAHSALSSSHDTNIFLNDHVDKHVSDFSHNLFRRGQNHDRHQWFPSPAPRENPNTALVLYREPSSISVPEEEDVVRKTIIEARRRAREKALVEERERQRGGMEVGHGVARDHAEHFSAEADLNDDDDDDDDGAVDAMEIE